MNSPIKTFTPDADELFVHVKRWKDRDEICVRSPGVTHTFRADPGSILGRLCEELAVKLPELIGLYSAAAKGE